MLLQKVTAAGGEGLMLRHSTAEYTGGRSTDLLKVKRFFDKDAVVIGYAAGTGRNAGRVGALVCVDGGIKSFKVGTGLSDAQRDTPPPIGACITYRYQEMHVSGGAPRFPVFVRVRPDE